jgi:hypothetical protein
VRIPRTNNVYGQVVAPDGLRAVVVAIEAALGPGSASMYRSRAGADAETLRIRTDVADFESLPLPGGIEHVLNGAVAGSPEDVAAVVRALSAALTDVKIEHNFEVHDGRRVVLSLP